MALKIVWSKRAILKFDQIISYLIDEWDEKIKGDAIILILFFDNRQNPQKKKF